MCACVRAYVCVRGGGGDWGARGTTATIMTDALTGDYLHHLSFTSMTMLVLGFFKTFCHLSDNVGSGLL